MKKLMTCMAAVALCAAPAAALPKAFYVKQGDKITKYNFGVAENLVFSDNGHTLSVRGYGQSVNLDEIDYISFTAPLAEALTPSEQKERMVKIGTEAYSAFDINDQADVLRMWHDFFDSDYDYTQYVYTYIAPVKYHVPAEYYQVHKQAGIMAEAMQSMVKGSPAAARIMKAAAVDLYKIEDYYGIYTADKATESWKKTESDHFEMRFAGRDGSQYCVKLVAGEEYTTWTTSDFDGRFPREIDITLSKGDATLATARLNTVLVNGTSIDMTLDFDASDYKVKNTLKVVDSNMTDNVKVTIKGREYVTAKSVVTGKNFVNYQEIFDAVKAAGGYYDENDSWVDEDGSALCAMFNRAECEIDVMGNLQLRGIAHNGSKLYADLSADASPYYSFVKDGLEIFSYGKILSQTGNTLHTTYEDLEVMGAQVNLLNNYTDVGFYYDGDGKLQGYLGWDYVEKIEDNYQYYDEPLTRGFCRMGEYLVSVSRFLKWDSDLQTEVLSPWTYYGHNIETGESVEMVVDDSDVITPELITHYYSIAPVLWFPDGTSFVMEDFFDEGSFAKLIDDYNDIINTYLSITGQK